MPWALFESEFPIWKKLNWFEKKKKKKKTSGFSTFYILFNDSWIMKYTWIKRDESLNNIFF